MSKSSSNFNGGFPPGAVVEGRYRIVRELGRGGMGAVYEAEQIKLQKQVALKVLQADRSRREDDGSSLKRFLREARAASLIQHRNVVTILDFGDLEDGSTYYVMELLEGRDLSSLLKDEGAMEWPRARRLLRQVLSALGAAHDKGIIHRDIKPANIMLLDSADEWGNELVKVLDFGIAKLQEVDEQSQSLTGTSELLGTAAYMAPELVRGEPTDERADLYAVGIVAYQLLTGVVPFQAVNTFQVLLRHLNDPPPPPRGLVPELSPAVDAFILRALAKDPDQRHPSAAAMIRLLDVLGDTPGDEISESLVAPVPSVAPMRTEVMKRPPVAAVPGATQRVSRIDPAKGTQRYEHHDGSTGQTSAAPKPEDSASHDAAGAPTVQLVDGTGSRSIVTGVATDNTGAQRIEPTSSARWGWPTTLLAVLAAGAAAVLVTWLAMNRDAKDTAAPESTVAVTSTVSEPKPAPTEVRETSAPVAPAPTHNASSLAPPVANPAAATAVADAGSLPTAAETTPAPIEPQTSNENDSNEKKGSSTSTSKCQSYECRQQRAEQELQKSVRRRCRSLASGEVIEVKLTIGTDGKVLMPRALPPHDRTALGDCVVEAVAQGRFPPPAKLSPKQLRLKP